MKIKIQLFASLKDAAKANLIEVEVPENSTVSNLKEAVAKDFPQLEKWLPHCRLAINEEYAEADQVVIETDDLALIPPVSGGSSDTLIKVVHRELSLDEVVKAVQNPQAGAVCTFLGVVRQNSKDLEGNSHEDIEFLDYEAYAPMAEKEMRAIAREAAEKWDATVALMHRTGRLGVGEASVAIAVATAHRAPSFEACRYVIEELKEARPHLEKGERARWSMVGRGECRLNQNERVSLQSTLGNRRDGRFFPAHLGLLSGASGGGAGWGQC